MNAIGKTSRYFLKRYAASSQALHAQLFGLCAGCHCMNTQNVQRRHMTAGSPAINELSTWQKFKWDMGFYGKLRVPNRNLLMSGFNLYTCCTDFVDFNQFVKVLELPDTFNSWFLLTQLHIWLVQVKLSQMGKEGALLKQHLYKAMWLDFEKRLETFPGLLGSERKEITKKYYSLMVFSLLYFDEGLIGSDQTLANALWVQLFSLDRELKAEPLDMMVEYVRKQVYHHDHLDAYPVMKPGYISFLPLLEDKLNKQKAEHDFQSLLNQR